MNFSDNLIKLRKGKSWSQEDLAEKLGISRQAVSKWEVGTSKPDIDNIIKISKLFEVSIDELVNNEIVRTEAISINVKRKSKKDVLLVWLRRIVIVLAIIYFINVIYKFAMLFTITQAELQYKELDNYHYVITKYDNDGIIEKEECWFKDGISRTVNILYEDKNAPSKRLICIDYNSNIGYSEFNDSERSMINVEEYENMYINYAQGGQFYDLLPVEINKVSMPNVIMRAFSNYKIDINIGENNLFFTYDNLFMNLEKRTMKPIFFYYKENKSEEFIAMYLDIELNSVKELKI